MVKESPDPMVQDQEEVGGGSDDRSGRGPRHNAASHNVGNNSVPTTTMPTESTTYPDLEEAANDGAGIHEEAASSPQEPFLGMRFDTMEVARAHYNAYAAKLGFSVKAHTSKRKPHTNELEKQQFV
ncbi:hypothetical protein ACQ4PT_067800 [Festuca glaucescens]